MHRDQEHRVAAPQTGASSGDSSGAGGADPRFYPCAIESHGGWEPFEPLTCDLCKSTPKWRHPDGGYRCGGCPRPGDLTQARHGNRLRQARRLAGLSAEQAARLMGWASGMASLYRMERGLRPVSDSEMERFARIYGCSVARLRGE